MEFKSLTNIETSFRQIRLFALVFICLCALVKQPPADTIQLATVGMVK